MIIPFTLSNFGPSSECNSSSALHRALSLRPAQLEEVFQNLSATFRQDAFRMELHTPNRQGFVFNTHDFALVCLCSDFKAVRQGIPLNDQRMIASGWERVR